METKHFWYYVQNTGARGRIAARVTCGRFEVHQVGRAAPVDVLPSLIKAMVDMEMCEQLHTERTHRYATEIRHGMSGCRDYYLVKERSVEWQDYPMHKLLHVSMFGNINENASVWLGDVPVLLEMLGDYSSEVELEECPVRHYNFKTAWDGFEVGDVCLSAETLERLRQIEFDKDNLEAPC